MRHFYSLCALNGPKRLEKMQHISSCSSIYVSVRQTRRKVSKIKQNYMFFKPPVFIYRPWPPCPSSININPQRSTKLTVTWAKSTKMSSSKHFHHNFGCILHIAPPLLFKYYFGSSCYCGNFCSARL